LETAAMAAWPALHQEILDGWCLRFADGYTKRANSANALRDIETLTAAQLSAVEDFYRVRGVASIFRLASFCTGPEVDAVLDRQGYQLADPSLVLVCDLQAVTRTESEQLADVSEWLTHYQLLQGASSARQTIHQRMLQAITGSTAFAIQRDRVGAIVGVALGVVSGDMLGLFDVVVSADSRGKGHGYQLCDGLLAWGRAQGATQAYLQVSAVNESAIRLYQRLGFRSTYRYWYRVKTP
jgi:ribosomal protein S18 acetylase RimI-like enzyme